MSPSQVVNLTVSVPFSADQNALVVMAGQAPSNISTSRAQAILRAVFFNIGSSVVPPHELLAGRVTLAPNLGAPALHATRAWVMIYEGGHAACPYNPSVATAPSVPATASGLNAIIVTTSDPKAAIGYYGEGTGLCPPPLTRPTATVGPTGPG